MFHIWIEQKVVDFFKLQPEIVNQEMNINHQITLTSHKWLQSKKENNLPLWQRFLCHVHIISSLLENAEKHVCKEYVPLQQICVFEKVSM